MDTMHCTGVDEGGVVLVVVVVVMVVASVVVVVVVFFFSGNGWQERNHYNQLYHVNMLIGDGCESCLKGATSDCFRIAMLKYIFGLACCGCSHGGEVIVVVVDYWWWC